MRKIRTLLILCVVLAGGGALADHEPTVYIMGVWAPPAADVSMVEMQIENAGDQPLALIAVSTLLDAVITLGGADDVLVESIAIAPGAILELGADADYALRLELADALAVGDAFALLLVFETADGDLLEVITGVPVLDDAPPATDFVVMDAWARPTPGGMMGDESATGEVSAVYLRLLNRSADDDRLLAITAEVAGLVEIHEMTLDANDIMRMRTLDALEIPAGGDAILAPGGDHIMLIDLSQPLAPGMTLTLTLLFESGQALMIGVPVRDPLADEQPHRHG